VSKQSFRALRHKCPSESITLIRSEVMFLGPSTADELLEVGARIDLLVIGGEVVKNFGRSVNAFWRQAEIPGISCVRF